jgi:hypothetical protein
MLSAFTLVHVALSLIGIVSGVGVAFGLLSSKRLDSLTALFLATTVLTSVTGFFFPFHGITPGIVIGILSLALLALALFARYPRRLAGAWRWIYALTAMIALYFNCFILVVQLFEKVPALHAIDPTRSGAPFKITQLLVLLFFAVLTSATVVKFHPKPAQAA